MTILDESNTIQRDRWGRPLIVPPEGGEPVAYRRPSTLGAAIEDTSNLEKYSMRMVALGLVARRDLLARVARCGANDKKELNELTSKAKEHAGSSIKSNTGTAIHSLLEQYDKGLDPTPLDELDERALRAWQKFRSITGWQVRGIEQFVVCDELKAAGTLDRVFNNRIADLKTGDSLQYGQGKFACQLAIYAGSCAYELLGGEAVRTPLNVDREVGYILHLPDPFDTVTVYELDLVRGWEVAKAAIEVVRVRAFKDLLLPHPLNPPPWETGSPPAEAEKPETKPKRKRAPKTVPQDAPGSANDVAKVSVPTEVADVLGRLRALSDMTRAHVLKWGREAKEAGFPIDVKTDPTDRKIAALAAMIAWAPFPDLARGAVLAVIGGDGDARDDSGEEILTGVLFSLLTIEQAQALVGGHSEVAT